MTESGISSWGMEGEQELMGLSCNKRYGQGIRKLSKVVQSLSLGNFKTEMDKVVDNLSDLRAEPALTSGLGQETS